MKMMAGVQKLNLDGIWTKREEQYAVVLRVDGWKESTYGQLRSFLFGWHKPSWYGTEIEETRLNGRTILVLTPQQAFEYLISPKPVKLLQVIYSERLSFLKELAKGIYDILEQGLYEPDSAKWSQEQFAWRVSTEGISETDWLKLLEQAPSFGYEHIDEWLTLIINDAISQQEKIRSCWHALELELGESALRTKVSDPDEWYMTIGFKEDTLPFKIALSLHEPLKGTSIWMLRTSIQNNADGEWYTIEHVGEQWKMIDAQGNMKQIDSSWLSYLPEKLKKESVRWKELLSNFIELEDGLTLQKSLTEQEAWRFLERESEALLEAGCKVILPAWWEAVRNRKLKMRGKVKPSVGSATEPMFGLDQIVQFDWKLALGSTEISEEQFFQLVEQNRKLVQIDEQWIYLNPEDVAQVKKWLKSIHKKKGLTFSDVLQMHLKGESAEWLDEQEDHDLQTEIELNTHLSSWLQQLQSIQDIPLHQPPSTFLGELRPYQLQGASWLLFLRQYGLGAVLADDMGLGKTIQYMAYLAFIKNNQPWSNPSLLICPTSVIGNWEREIEKFMPSLNVIIHYGGKRLKGEQLAEQFEGADLVITSYSLAQIDSEELEQFDWESLCLDEAQNIKNAYTKQAGAIRKFSAKHRIALTGTPMENRLTELWSIYDFINPGYLGSLYQFRKTMIVPIERNKDDQRIQGLQRWVKPFMLRREKKDPSISISLPEKLEMKSYIPLTAEQVTIYENVVNELMERLDKELPMQRRGLILSSLTKLKQLCDHPALFLEKESKKLWDMKRSNKLERLVEIMDNILEQGERCLIFTQYIEMGSQIQRLLEQRYKIKVPYLHGAIPKVQRDEMIHSFQNENERHIAFVLSLKAGGTGLNLTAANHVIHFDRWWNPAVENQATDRAFRIGQTKQVQVHKFVTVGTLEEKIDEMIDGKQALNDLIVRQSDQWITELGKDELRELFTLRDTWLKE